MDAPDSPRLGISGRLARIFQDNPLTPILALVGLLLGLVAVAITPREEEPQIDVTMANVIVPFPGADARQVEQMVAFPLEQKLAEIEQVKHTYSISRPGMAILTVEFEVGVQRQPALVRLYDKVFSNQDWMPQNLGVGQVTCLDSMEMLERKEEFLAVMRRLQEERHYNMVILMLTDVLLEGTQLLYVGSDEAIRNAFSAEPKDNALFLPGVMSRKKQVIPMLSALWG